LSTPFEFCRIIWRQKTSLWAIVWHYLRNPAFSRLDTILECDRQTDRQTDRHMTMAYTVLA